MLTLRSMFWTLIFIWGRQLPTDAAFGWYKRTLSFIKSWSTAVTQCKHSPDCRRAWRMILHNPQCFCIVETRQIKEGRRALRCFEKRIPVSRYVLRAFRPSNHAEKPALAFQHGAFEGTLKAHWKDVCKSNSQTRCHQIPSNISYLELVGWLAPLATMFHSCVLPAQGNRHKRFYFSSRSCDLS